MLEGLGPKKIYSVSELTYEIGDLLEKKYPFVLVEGEISNLRIPASGHIYFMLKDDEAQLRCVMFKDKAKYLSTRAYDEPKIDIDNGDESQPSLFSEKFDAKPPIPFEPEDGQHVIAIGRIGVYSPRGEYQLIADNIEPVGIGAMTIAFEQLKKKLSAKGYFDRDRKKPIPFLPKRIAVVTSPTGAALFDMLKVIYERHPGAHVIIVPVRVQGEGAEREIARGLDLINRHDAADVIICGRGGGSIEDLWAFNTEDVADAFFRSKIPVISAVGHEIDITIADLASDERAPTPTAAAQIAVPRLSDLIMTLDLNLERLKDILDAVIQTRKKNLESLIKMLKKPKEVIYGAMMRIEMLSAAMITKTKSAYSDRRARFETLVSALERLSPLGVLSRGYSITQRADDGKIITSSSEIDVGDLAKIRLYMGTLLARITERKIEEK